MTVWILFSLLTAALLTAAAASLDLLVRSRGRPTRGVWFAAMVGSVLLPLARLVAPEVATAGLAEPLGTAVVVLGGLTVGSGAEAAEFPAALVFAAAWALVSMGLALRVAVSWISARRLLQAAEPRTLHGESVLVTDHAGPALIGVRRPRIVLPRWALDASDTSAWILRHEREHLCAGDTRLLAAAYGLLVLIPWNPFLWIQQRRLRLAVECDCDARVLGTGARPIRAYCELLLAAGSKGRQQMVPVVALSEPRSFLERRIERMTERRGDAAPFLVVVLGAMAALALSIAVLMPWSGAPERAVTPTEAVDMRTGPTFTPYTIAPRLKNRQEVMAALQAEYPPLLRDAGVGGTTNVWFFIDETGSVQDVRVQKPSGHTALDGAAVAVARIMEFEPALNRDRPTPVWVAFPITFQSSSGG